MTTPPRPTTPPPPPPKPGSPPKPAAENDEHEHERRKRDDDDEGPVTVQTDQLRRSAEMEKEGVAKWVEDHDERKGADRPAPRHGGQVPGVSPTQKDDPGGRRA